MRKGFRKVHLPNLQGTCESLWRFLFFGEMFRWSQRDSSVKRAAVFMTDVAGNSRLMGEDEMATVKTLKDYKGVIFTLIKQHRGRVVESPGDNLLADFPS
jgi:class 3 adenylate cyclase